MKKLEIQERDKEKQIELQKEQMRIQLQEKQIEHEKEKEEREYHIKMKELDISSENRYHTSNSNSNFDLARNIRLVPHFKEKEVDKYFILFEKVAENLKWPRENWTQLLQCVITGKASEIYTSLSVQQSSDYDGVKEYILRGYELVPEAYRQKFRNYRKQAGQTHIEFAREKEQLFDRWCLAKKVEQDYQNLKLY